MSTHTISNHLKPKKMRDLLELAMKATQDNVVSKSSKESINDALLRILYEGKEELTKIELIARISLDRLKAEYGEDALQKMDDDEFKKLLKSTNKTVKNGIDTSVSRSNNNSSFHFNPKYEEYKMELVGNKVRITDRKKKSK